MSSEKELAFEIISGYPLYASTSGITGDEAIEIAKIIEPEIKNWQNIVNENNY
jgi:hypothetical protein